MTSKRAQICRLALEGLNSNQIAERLRADRTYIRKVVRKNGIALKRPPSDKMIDVAGQLFGSLTAIDRASGCTWRCACACGGEKIVSTSSLRGGTVISCGCRYQTGEQVLIHGMCGTSEYGTWMAMKARCLNPKTRHFKHYGGRGITICARWLDGFEPFYEDMGARPSSSHSIDRIDVNGNYEPSNCRWATWTEQANNKRPRQRRSA